MGSDRIEKEVTLRASRARVWKALTDEKQFGTWFGVELDGPFVAGAAVRGRIVPTAVDPDTAALQEPHRGLPVEWQVERMDETNGVFAFRWHPFAIERDVDYAQEPTTLVTFEIVEAAEGTHLRITESGFDQVPLERRVKAFTANEGGWSKQTELIRRYVEQ